MISPLQVFFLLNLLMQVDINLKLACYFAPVILLPHCGGFIQKGAVERRIFRLLGCLDY